MKSRGGAALLVAALLSTMLAGCGEDDGGGKASASGSGTPSESAVKVLDVGAEPREELRLKVSAGDTQQMLMRMENATTTTIDGSSSASPEIPPMVMATQVDVENVQPDGTIEASFSYGDVQVEGTDALAAQLEKILDENMDGITGTIVTTGTGEYVDGDIDIDDDVDPSLRSTMRSMESQLSSMAVPFPTEAVGIGARWTATTETEVNGIDAITTYRYELLERRGDTLVLDVATDVTAPQQETDLPGVPAGVTVELRKMDLAGSGRIEFDLGRLMPVDSRATTTGEIRMRMSADGSASTMVQKLRMIFRLSPA